MTIPASSQFPVHNESQLLAQNFCTELAIKKARIHSYLFYHDCYHYYVVNKDFHVFVLDVVVLL